MTMRWMEISDDLRDAIIAHRLKPGMRLAEDELCAIYGHSRTVIRGALQTLTREGLLSHVPNRGVHVAQPSRNDALEVFEARLLLETEISRLAAARATASDIGDLRQHRMREKSSTDDHHSSNAISLSARFHIEIARIAGNAMLTDIITELVSRSSLIVALYWHETGIICDNCAHDNLVDAIEAGNGDEAARLMRLHLEEIRAGLDLDEHPDADADTTLADILGNRQAG